MNINPAVAIAAGAAGIGAGVASWASTRSSSSDGVGRFTVPIALGTLGGAATILGLATRARSSSAVLGALPFVGGALLAGGATGALVGALTHRDSPAKAVGTANDWPSGERGHYGMKNPTESWDADDPTGTPHPTDYDAVEGDILPNIVPQQPGTVRISVEGDKRFLDFATTTGNLGAGPLTLLRHTDVAKPIMQVITNADGSTRELATDRDTFEDGPGTNHLAFDDFARYELFRADADGHPTGEVARSQYKESFLIIDTNHVDPTIDPEGKLRVNRSVPGAEVQGISPGYGDTYGPGLCGQSFDISDLPDGRYVLRQSMDPGERFVETDDADNVRDTVLDIHGDQVRVVSSDLVRG